MADSKPPPALKHGVYSGLGLLPGEDPVAFEKLRAEIVVKYVPSDPLESDVVETIARLLWRKQNIGTYRLARGATKRWSEIKSRRYPSPIYPRLGVDQQQARALHRADKRKAKADPGPAWELVQANEVCTPKFLLDEISLLDRLDGMIDRCLKRLLYVRGLKSLPTASASEGEIRLIEAAWAGDRAWHRPRRRLIQ